VFPVDWRNRPRCLDNSGHYRETCFRAFPNQLDGTQMEHIGRYIITAGSIPVIERATLFGSVGSSYITFHRTILSLEPIMSELSIRLV
jgi:hypothetical protein